VQWTTWLFFAKWVVYFIFLECSIISSQKIRLLLILFYSLGPGQSELTATNAPVGRSVHWMGCVFSFGAGWGSSQSISFCY
jgi:hypothetical protein